MTERPGFVLYRRQKTLFDHLTIKERGELISAIFDYFCGEERPQSKSKAVSMAFDMIVEQLDFDSAEYEKKCKMQSEKANKRWKKQNENMPSDAAVCHGIFGNADACPTDTSTVTNTDTDTNTNTKTITGAGTGTNTNASASASKNSAAAEFSTPTPTRPVEKEGMEEEYKIYGAFNNVMLRESDYLKLKEEFDYELAPRINRLSEYIVSHGDKYPDHAAVIRRWALTDYPDRYKQKQVPKPTPKPESKSDDDFDVDAYFEAALKRAERYFAEHQED